jgi:hypothetical protein
MIITFYNNILDIDEEILDELIDEWKSLQEFVR